MFHLSSVAGSLSLLIIHATDAEIAWIHIWFNSLDPAPCKHCYIAH